VWQMDEQNTFHQKQQITCEQEIMRVKTISNTAFITGHDKGTVSLWSKEQKINSKQTNYILVRQIGKHTSRINAIAITVNKEIAIGDVQGFLSI
jgi:hypothetical protein